MKVILFVIFCLAFCFSGLLRCVIFNVFKAIYNVIVDTYNFFKYKKFQDFNYYGIYNFCGMFGHGKTLSATSKIRSIYRRYKKYGKEVRIISNVKLTDVPYIPLVSFQQVVDIADIALNGEDSYCGTILFIDEVENLLSHRKFSSFPMELMHTLTQQRKCHLVVFSTAQRFHMIDKCWRDISTFVVECNKYWRFQHLRYYDAFDIENAINTQLVKCQRSEWFFVTNKHYSGYDTTEMITKHSAEDFISNDEVLTRRGSELMFNDEGVKHPSRKLQNRRRKQTRKKSL